MSTQTSTPHKIDEIEDGPDMQPTPSWFAGTYGEATPEELARRYSETTPPPITAGHSAAYAAYQKRMEDRFAMAQKMVDEEFGVQNNYASVSQSFPQRPRYSGAPAVQPPPAQRLLGVRPATLAILTLAACGLGGAGGMVAANPQHVAHLAQQSLALAGSIWFKPADPVQETVLEKKLIQTTKLEVKNAEGAINAPIPLDIAATPLPGEAPFAFRISGLPDAAYLTRGVQVATGEWLLKSEDIALAELVVPHTTTPEIALQVSALEASTGLPAAPSQDLNVRLDMNAVPVPGVPQPKLDEVRIQPAAAEADQGFNKSPTPPAIPLPLESLNPEVQALMSKGNGLLAAGDVLAARQFYLKAFSLNAPEAAFGMGQTFDPGVYKQHKIKGLVADPKLASEWYGKAAAAGFENASAAIAQLPLQP